MLTAEPRFQEFLGRGVAERGMLSLPVAKRFDDIEQISLRFILCPIAGAMHSLILQTVEEALGRRIVPVVCRCHNGRTGAGQCNSGCLEAEQ